jgi:hypothetical protein
MKKILYTISLLAITAHFYAQKCWAYEEQKNGKSFLSGAFTKTGKTSWIEKNNAASFNFEEMANKTNEIILFDKTRNIYVKLTSNEMWASIGNDKNWQKNYEGRWKHWYYSEQNRPDGVYEGTFTFIEGTKWIEKNNHSDFTFTEYSYNQDELILFDRSRNVYVKITPTELFASWKQPGTWEKYYDGEWQ